MYHDQNYKMPTNPENVKMDMFNILNSCTYFTDFLLNFFAFFLFLYVNKFLCFFFFHFLLVSLMQMRN